MAEDCTPLAPSGGCDIAGLHLQSTGKRLPKDTGGGHEFVTELPETGDDGVEYVLMDDISDCSSYKGTYVYDKDCGGWICTSGAGGGSIDRYTFEQTATGWRAKRNNTVIFTYVDKDTIDSYEDTADGFQIIRNGVVIFTHTDGGGGDCKEYTITATADGWVFKEDGVTKFTYTEPANDPSDGTYFTSGTLTTAITGTTTVAASSVTGLTLADVVIGETLIYDEAGSVGRVTAVNGTNLTVETITTAPGERRGTRLGAVDDYTDLPATCAAATALGWQTPLAGDFAYVREDTSHDSHLTEWVISSIDSSCNITWGYSHTLNAGNYVLDLYKYGDYPSGSPIPKNPDGSVTLPKDENTKYDFENVMDGSDIIGWRVKDHDSGTVLYTYTDKDEDTTYTFSDVVVGGKVVGWKVVDSNGTTVYTYTDLNDESDGAYLTSETLSTTIADTTSVPVSSVSGFAITDVVDGETLIYDGVGTVGVVTAHTSTTLTVTTMTVSGSGDASSFVYNTTDALDEIVGNQATISLANMSKTDGTTPVSSDIIVGKTIVWDDEGAVGVVDGITGSSVSVTTITIAGSGGGSTPVEPSYELKSAMYKLIQNGKADTPDGADYGTVVVAKGAIMPFHKISGDFENGTTQGTFIVPNGMRIEANIHMTLWAGASGSANPINVRAWLYNATDNVYCKGENNESIPSAYGFTGEHGTSAWTNTGYAMGRGSTVQWTNNTGHAVMLGFRLTSFGTNDGLPAAFRTDATSMAVKQIGQIVDPIKYLDKFDGLQDSPVGNIISYMGNNTPKHYLDCDGTVYNIGDYPELEQHFKTEFGSVNYFGGNGTTTWAVPNLQGEFLRGTGTNSHAKNGDGAAVGVHQDATQISGLNADNSGGIYATTTSESSNGFAQRGNGTILHAEEDYVEAAIYNKYRNVAGNRNTNPSNTDGAYTARPTNTSVKYCIKYESNLQVIAGDNNQYKVHVPFSVVPTSAGAVATLNKTSADAKGNMSLIDSNNAFVAPVDGWYAFSAKSRQTNVSSGTGRIVCYWRKNGDTTAGGTFANDSTYTAQNIQSVDFASTIYLSAGEYIQLSMYGDSGFSSVTFTGELDVVQLTAPNNVYTGDLNLIAADDVYSYDEQLVGSFLGKPLYKRTFRFNTPTVDNTITYSTSSIPIERMIKGEGTVLSSDSQHTPIPWVWQSANDNMMGWYWSPSAKCIYVRLGTGGAHYANKPCDFTLWYTKTSDAANSAPNKNSLLLTRPDLWTAGVEYDFGGGLYGKRLKGTAAFAADSTGRVTWNTNICTSVATTAKIINKGGMIDMSKTSGTNWYDINGSWNNGNNTLTQSVAAYFLATNTSNNLKFYGVVNGGAGNYQYDIWFTYTKS